MTARFEMILRHQKVHVVATILSWTPKVRLSITLTNEAGVSLPWKLTRQELARVCRCAARASPNDVPEDS